MMMSLLATATAAQLKARLQQQILEVATLRLALDMQSNRIAHTLPDFVWPDQRKTLPEIGLHTPSYLLPN
jgi:hypothetical protein